MNNRRLLAGLACAAMLSASVCGHASTVVTLEEIFAAAEAHSAQLRPALAAQEEAELGISEARAARLPDINASLAVSYIGDGFTTKRNFADYQKAPIPHLGTGLSLAVNQLVYAGGAITAGIDMARLKSTAARFATDMARDNVRIRLAGDYLDIYKYSNLRGVVERNIESARKVLAEMEARHAQGTVLRNDITRYELLVSNLELQLVKINNMLDILNRNLVTVTGLPEGTAVEPDSTILARALPMQGESWWQQEALRESPALSLARNGVSISQKAEALAQAERMPKVGLQAGWTMDGPILVEIPPINRNLSYWYVGVGVSYNLSSLYKTNKSLARSRAATVKAQEEFAAASENVNLAVHGCHVRYLEAYEELKTREKSVELAERNYRNVATRYAEGMALVTDMLDAADARLNAQQQLVNARIDIIYHYYQLLFTAGTI